MNPDLTTFGKIMAGGTPSPAFGGRYDLMQQYSPESQTLLHAGTLNANPLMGAAGVAQLEQITPELIERLNSLGGELAEGMRQVFRKAVIKGQVAGMGSLRNVHFGPVPVVDGHTSRNTTNRELLHLFHLSLLHRGILIPDRAMFCISSPMSQREVKIAIDAVEDSMFELKPYIEQIWPELMGHV